MSLGKECMCCPHLHAHLCHLRRALTARCQVFDESLARMCRIVQLESCPWWRWMATGVKAAVILPPKEAVDATIGLTSHAIKYSVRIAMAVLTRSFHANRVHWQGLFIS